MAAQVVADASVFLASVLQEPYGKQADQLLDLWSTQQIRVVVPTLLRYEVVAVLRKNVHRGILTPEAAAKVRVNLQALTHNLTFMIDDGLLQRGYELAEQLHRPTAYDAQYLSVAERLSCEFWTADERLFNAIRRDFGNIRWLGSLISE